ncbi:hypothetical protein LTR44_002963 [Exophiala sp. CCFEE 6388]|uniref:Uncharacterized protein n=1 Tax=Exophiala sideris TaxID=1016849 RepID=A0ABR0JMB7_9EURO|nr:hypothetical protein LTR69_002407 [Exophiala sideris]KAK5185116.1 hypothetical protein LTR44_002963 [Eurotiomycetes sp. CCFEE 6388]
MVIEACETKPLLHVLRGWKKTVEETIRSLIYEEDEESEEDKKIEEEKKIDHLEIWKPVYKLGLKEDDDMIILTPIILNPKPDPDNDYEARTSDIEFDPATVWQSQAEKEEADAPGRRPVTRSMKQL